MKLNNKGFAFSTMLYGTLALITLVLYAILSNAEASNDTTYYYGSAIEAKLNECISEEIALENCYSSGSGTCDPTSYHACLGISDNTPIVSGKIISEKLLETKVTSGDGLRLDPYVTNRYIYVGNTVNNYLEYSGKVWRIVSVEPDGTVRLIDYSANINEKWDTETEDVWATSTLRTYLVNQYMTQFTDNSKFTSGKWQATMYSHEGITNLSIDDLILQDNNRDAEDSSYAQVGLLTIKDYMKATTTSSCTTSVLTATSCTSWLSNYKGWTLNIDADETTISIAY